MSDPPLSLSTGDRPRSVGGEDGRGTSVWLHSFDGQDMSAKLEGLCMRMGGVEDDRTTEAGELSMLVMKISNAPHIYMHMLYIT
jgi:hypothetical protein